jgi:hypothetical protein
MPKSSPDDVSETSPDNVSETETSPFTVSEIETETSPFTVSEIETEALVRTATQHLHHEVLSRHAQYRVVWGDEPFGLDYPFSTAAEAYRFAESVQRQAPGPYRVERRDVVTFVSGWGEATIWSEPPLAVKEEETK